MKIQNREIDMLQGSLISKILLFTLPIALASMLQQLFNVTDASIIGLFGSSDALAAVGTNGEIIALIVSLSSGLSIGVNVLIANQIGKKELKQISAITHTAILFALGFGIMLMIAGQCICTSLLRLIQTPDNIFHSAEIYLRIYFLGYPFLLLYDFCASILRARGDSRYPFIALTVAGIINVLLNIVFVAVFHIGVAGVAIATDLSTLFSAMMVIRRLRNDATEFHISLKDMHIHVGFLLELFKIGIPSAIQGAVFCFANIFVQACVNSFGSDVIAGSTIAMNFEYFAYYVITAFGQTATTFTSQNYAANQKLRCRKILILCTIFSFLCSMLIIVPIIVFPEVFTKIFSNNPLVIENAVLRINSIFFFEAICSFYEVPAGVLRGMGHSLLPAIATIIGTCAFRILWIFIVFEVNPSLVILYKAFPFSWIFTIILIACSFIVIKSLSAKKLSKTNYR